MEFFDILVMQMNLGKSLFASKVEVCVLVILEKLLLHGCLLEEFHYRMRLPLGMFWLIQVTRDTKQQKQQNKNWTRFLN